jgi:predicted CXXCH cytochrome family protein
MKPSRRKPAQTTGVPVRTRRLRGIFLLAVGVVIGSVLAAVYGFGLWKKGEEEPLAEPPKNEQIKKVAKDTPPLMAAATSPYKNTQPGVKYVGSQACIACHEPEHKTFQHTGMAHSFAAVDLSREPPDGSYDHPASHSRYEVRRKDGKMWHREFLSTGGKEELLLQEYPVKYVTGSGRHALTYVVEEDGFLMESPITWYASRKTWGMSPGYDRPDHSGFEREIRENCLMCHAGQVKPEGKSMHRLQITEAAIGCERCHGPGELHIQRQEAARKLPAKVASEADDTIVNPVRLTRELSEAVCQQCHLRASAAVMVKGKGPLDFRPGLPLSEFVQHFELETSNPLMAVVGHVEQMHQSKCYQATKTFSCLTCHDPHGAPANGEALTKHYLEICAGCHQPEACHVSPELRQKKSPRNDCLVCHMPQTLTDIPHVAFTHHRVGIHDAADTIHSATPPDSVPLRSVLDLSSFNEREQNRARGLAYLEIAMNEEVPSRRLQCERQGFALLSTVRASGGVDGTVDAWLARLRSEQGMPDASRYAQSSLADPELTGQDLCNALFVTAESQFQKKRYGDATRSLEQLNTLRRNSMQWLRMAQCQDEAGNAAAVEQALLQAVRINPRLTKIHQQLAAFYRQRGNGARAKYHEARAVP